MCRTATHRDENLIARAAFRVMGVTLRGMSFCIARRGLSRVVGCRASWAVARRGLWRVVGCGASWAVARRGRGAS
jgi:hypothetical protein